MGAAQPACSSCCKDNSEHDVKVNITKPDPVPGNPNFSELGTLKVAASAPTPADSGTQALSGQHSLQWDDGSSYIGSLVDGKKHGYGKWMAAGRRAAYEGEWQNDCMHGKGYQAWQDGRTYNGEFINGRFCGHGKMVWNAEKGHLIYEGQYKDDMKHGEGRFTWADGRVYEGEWDHGKRHGKGVYTNSIGERKVGYWKKNQWERWEE